MKANCSTCAYWLKQQGSQGICRRYPPTVVLIPGTARATSSLALPGLPQAAQQIEVQVQSMFPTMLANGWCGEHPDLDGAFNSRADISLAEIIEETNGKTQSSKA